MHHLGERRNSIGQCKHQVCRAGSGGHTGVARIFVGGGHPADATRSMSPVDANRPMPPILASVVYTCEALAGIWGSASAPAVLRTAGALADLLIMGGAQSENKLQKISVK